MCVVLFVVGDCLVILKLVFVFLVFKVIVDDGCCFANW